MKVLITGFEPFGGERINPAFEVLKVLSNSMADAEIIKLEIPTAFSKSTEVVKKAIEIERPDFILCVGQAGGRSAISVERIAINIDDARIPDNEGQQPMDAPIDPNGPAAYFATIPYRAIVSAIKSQGIPAVVSDTAGTFVCNHIMYGVLHYAANNGLPIKAGFIHIPFLPEQVIDKPNVPSMSLDLVVKAMETAIAALVASNEDIKAVDGNIF